MNLIPSDVAFTPAVKAVQARKGSRSSYARMEERGGWQTKVTSELRAFLAERDMFYLGTSNSDGQPYIQYRGGAPGFLKVLDEETLGFADLGGNQQFITVGNLSENPKAFVFLIDYENRRRIKLWGSAYVVEDDPDLLVQLHDPDYTGKAERVILFKIEAWDINCPQHIHRRLPYETAAMEVRELNLRIQELEARLKEYDSFVTVHDRGNCRPQ